LKLPLRAGNPSSVIDSLRQFCNEIDDFDQPTMPAVADPDNKRNRAC